MEHSDSPPDLEAPFDAPMRTMIDKSALPIGDPAHPYDESNVTAVLEKRSQAVTIYKQNQNEALLLLSDCIELFPSSALYLNSRAEVFQFHGDAALALRDLRLVETRCPNPPFKTYKILAEVLFDLQEFSQCLVSCRKALQLEEDENIRTLMVEATKRDIEQKKQQQAFEAKQRAAKAPKKEEKKEHTIHGDIQDEIKQKYGDNPVYSSPLFQNLFQTAQNMDGQKAEKLMQNETLMQIFQDPEFGKKISEVAANPAAAAKYSNDPGFMKAFQTVLGAFK